MKKTCAVISETLNKNVRNPIHDNIVIHGVNCSDKQLIADNFNNFFASIGKLNASNIGRHHDLSYHNYLPERTDSNFLFHSINRSYIIQIIKNIKLSRSNGHDSILSELLKLVNIDISGCITLIITQSLRSGIFPDHLKIAKVTPIYKKDDKKLIKIIDQYPYCQSFQKFLKLLSVIN